MYFMITGHTKFSPDSHFGTIKGRLKRGECQSILDLVESDGVIRNSGVNNLDVPYKNPDDGEVAWKWRDWKSFLKSKFCACKGISGWHVIKIRSEGDYIKVAEKLGHPLADYKILKDDLVLLDEPVDIEPTEISSRLEDLRYYERFVGYSHKYFIACNY